MDDGGDLLDARFEHPVRGRIRDHQCTQRGGVLLRFRPQIFDIDIAVRIGLDHHHVEAGHHCTGWIGAVRRLRNQAHRAVRVLARFMIRADDEQAGILAL